MQLPLHDPCISHLMDYPRKLLSTEKAKSCPRPAKKQNRVHNLPKSKIVATTLRKPKPRYVSANRKMESLLPSSVMTPDCRNPLKQGFFSLPLCISCHQNYGLDVARGNKIDTYFLYQFAQSGQRTYRAFFVDLPVRPNMSRNVNLIHCVL